MYGGVREIMAAGVGMIDEVRGRSTEAGTSAETS
jgi:hypothetical protein